MFGVNEAAVREARVLGNAEGRDKDGGEGGVRDRNGRLEDARRDRRVERQTAKLERKKRPNQQQRQKLLITERLAIFSRRILSEVVSVCQAWSRRH